MNQANPTAQSEALYNQTYDRRKPDEQVAALTAILSSVQSLHKDMKKLDEIQLEQIEIKHSIKDVKADLTGHVTREEGNWEHAFVDGDADSHRRYHEAQIKKAEAEAEVWLIAKKKMIDLTVYGIVVGFGILVLYYWNGHVPASMATTVLPRLGG